MAQNGLMFDVHTQNQAESGSRWVSVIADADPAILPQLLGLVATINLCPYSMGSTMLKSGQLEWRCELNGVSESQWQFLLRKVSQPTQVWSVTDQTPEFLASVRRRAS